MDTVNLRVKNATIKRTFLGYQDHGLLTATLDLDDNAGVQAFGGYRLDQRDGPHQACGFFIARVLQVVGVKSWEELEGKLVRVARTPHGQIVAIAHIVENKWFEVRDMEKVR